MFPSSQCPRLRSLAQPGSPQNQIPLDRHQGRPIHGVEKHEACCTVDASSFPSGIPIDRCCRRRPDAPAGSRLPAPQGHGARPGEGILGHLDALYALAYLSSADAEGAQAAVITAFIDVCGELKDTPKCRSRQWRRLADKVSRASEGLHPSSAGGPFCEAALSSLEREAIALVLGGTREREAARLLSVSVNKLHRYLHAGLKAVQITMVTDRHNRYPFAAIGEDDKPTAQ